VVVAWRVGSLLRRDRSPFDRLRVTALFAGLRVTALFAGLRVTALFDAPGDGGEDVPPRRTFGRCRRRSRGDAS